MVISREIIQKLLLLLRPHLQDEKERKGYLITALGTNNIYALNLIWNQNVNSFIPNMVQQLVKFGEVSRGQPALCALLEVMRENLGVEKQDIIDKLLQQIKMEFTIAELLQPIQQSLNNAVAQIYELSEELKETKQELQAVKQQAIRIESGVWSGGWGNSGWTLNQDKDEERTFTTYIPFSRSFDKKPSLVVGITKFGVGTEDTIARLKVWATDIRKEGFSLNIGTWCASKVHDVDVSWLAYG